MHAHRFFESDEERRKWQNPEIILGSIGLKRGYTFIDVGCGNGFFALPAARIVGKNGRVYGVDIDTEAIAILKKKVSNAGLRNVELKAGAAEKTILCKACGDIVFFGIDLHDFDDPAKVLLNAKRMLKPTGRLVDLDWKKELMNIGPPLQIRFDEEKATSLILAAGFRIESIREVGSHHYMVVAEM